MQKDSVTKRQNNGKAGTPNPSEAQYVDDALDLFFVVFLAVGLLLLFVGATGCGEAPVPTAGPSSPPAPAAQQQPQPQPVEVFICQGVQGDDGLCIVPDSVRPEARVNWSCAPVSAIAGCKCVCAVTP